MKKLISITLVLLSFSLSFTSCSKEDDETVTPTTAPEPLTSEEEAGLLQMREEEKLARDVYLYAFDLYGTPIFNNIASSEQTHMDRILDLLDTYQLEDPAFTTRGVFKDGGLQSLYQTLTAKCNISLNDALYVGATIEDLDIYDLDSLVLRTEKVDIQTTYENLNCGSRNHLRAFNGQIVSNGGSYTAQYISAGRLSGILLSAQEKCGQ